MKIKKLNKKIIYICCICFLILIIIINSPFILNIFVSNNEVKYFIANKINEIIINKTNSLPSTIKKPYMTKIYDIYLRIYEFPIDNLKIHFKSFSLNKILLKIKGCKGYIKFKVKVGFEKYFNLNDEITIYINDLLIYYDFYIHYYPLKIINNKYSCDIYFETKAKKIYYDYTIKQLIQFFKKEIEDEMNKSFKNIPNLIDKDLKYKIYEKFPYLNIIQIYSSIYNFFLKNIIALITLFFFILFLLYNFGNNQNYHLVVSE